MAFSFQHVGQADLGVGKMPKPDVLARCHASGKTTGAMTQENFFFPPPQVTLRAKSTH